MMKKTLSSFVFTATLSQARIVIDVGGAKNVERIVTYNHHAMTGLGSERRYKIRKDVIQNLCTLCALAKHVRVFLLDIGSITSLLELSVLR